jgi:D-psicose/D-tagatose/L-ribulose 3-epimerase
MRNKLQLGVCTWTFGARKLDVVARRVAALGFDGVELMGDVEGYPGTEAAQVLADHGLKVFSLTPDNVDLAHPDTVVRSEAIDYYLRLLEWADGLGEPIVSCHGYVGRVRPMSTMAEERALFISAVRRIAERAHELNLRVAMEALNRYESHLLNTAVEALEFVVEVGSNGDIDNLGILLDAYHMNIEEAHPAAAIRHAGEHLLLYHAADSNRQGIGRGHTDFDVQLAALAEIGYGGPIIVECTAPGPDPFTDIKGDDSLDWLETFLRESRAWLMERWRD